MTLFLSCQINTILSSIYTKHRDKKIPLANSLLRRVTAMQIRSTKDTFFSPAYWNLDFNYF